MQRTLWLSLIAAVSALALVAAGCGGGGDDEGGPGGEAANQVITVNWGTEPPSLDPGLATDTTSANILVNIMDPLIKLDDDLNPVASLAERWDESADGTTYTFHLRRDGKWTNGDPVTARDFEYAWKRTLSPQLGADYAYQFYGITGAEEYNTCESNCGRLRDGVGVQAVDDYTLRVELTSPQPWFLKQLAHHSFLAVNQKAVEQHGENWTEAQNIVTNGPFTLARWDHNSRIDLVKWNQWRNADDVTLQRVNGRMITDGTTAVQAFEAGEIDWNQSIPPQEMARLKAGEEFETYPGLGTYYYGFNIKAIPDVNQRRAMSLAIDRRTIVEQVAQGGQKPATGYTPEGMPGFQTINPKSEWLPEAGNMARAKQLMAAVTSPVRTINLFHNEDPAHRSIAVAIQDQWRELGLKVNIRAQEWAQFLEFLGPPPNNSVHVYRLGWIGDYVDAMNFLEMWTGQSGNNNTNYSNPRYDRLVTQARQTENDEERFELYAQMEQMLFGENGDLPFTPIYWYTYNAQERSSIKETFNLNLLDQVDLTQVQVEG